MAEVLRENLQIVNDIFIEEIMDKMEQKSLIFFKNCLTKDSSIFNSIKMKAMYNEYIKSEIHFFISKFGREYKEFLNDMMKGNLDPLVLDYKNKTEFERIIEQLNVNKHINNLTIIKDDRKKFYNDIKDESLNNLTEVIKNLNELFIFNIELRKNQLTKNSLTKFIKCLKKFKNIRSIGLDFGDLKEFDDYLLNETCKVLLNIKSISALAISFHKLFN